MATETMDKVKRGEISPEERAALIALLEDLGVLGETTGRQRDRTFGYAKYLDRLRVGTELR